MSPTDPTDPIDPIDPIDRVEPAGSEADLIEQGRDVAPSERERTFVVPDDPEVPLADAWEGSLEVTGEEDDR